MAVKMTWLDKIAGWLLVASGLFWGSIGFLSIDLAGKFIPMYSHLLYKIVGGAAVYFIWRAYKKFE